MYVFEQKTFLSSLLLHMCYGNKLMQKTSLATYITFVT